LCSIIKGQEGKSRDTLAIESGQKILIEEGTGEEKKRESDRASYLLLSHRPISFN